MTHIFRPVPPPKTKIICFITVKPGNSFSLFVTAAERPLINMEEENITLMHRITKTVDVIQTLDIKRALFKCSGGMSWRRYVTCIKVILRRQGWPFPPAWPYVNNWMDWHSRSPEDESLLFWWYSDFFLHHCQKNVSQSLWWSFDVSSFCPPLALTEMSWQLLSKKSWNLV